MHIKVPFDTNLLVKRLTASELDTKVASTLTELIRESLIPALQESSVARSDFEKEMSLFNVEMSKLKGELQMRQAQTYQSNKLAIEQLFRELCSNRQRSREALSSIRSEMRLEVNLERGKQRDTVLATTLKYQDMVTRIEEATGNSYAALAKLRHEIFYSLTGFMFTGIAALFGFLRLTTSV